MNDSGSKAPLVAVLVGITILAVIAFVYLADVDRLQEAKTPNVDVTIKKEVTVPKVEVTPPEQTEQKKPNN